MIFGFFFMIFWFFFNDFLDFLMIYFGFFYDFFRGLLLSNRCLAQTVKGSSRKALHLQTYLTYLEREQLAGPLARSIEGPMEAAVTGWSCLKPFFPHITNSIALVAAGRQGPSVRKKQNI